jgi:hypothetical protein
MVSSKKKQDIEFDYNSLKGKIAEKIIEQLYCDLGYEVYPHGIENSIPNYKARFLNLSKDSKKALLPIRQLPDFVVISPDKQSAFMIEVKYRSSKYFKTSDFKNYHFPDVIIILVTTEGIINILAKDLIKHSEKNINISLSEFENLANSNVFSFSEPEKLAIRQAEEKANILFTQLYNTPEMVKAIEAVKEPDLIYPDQE